MRNSEFGHAVGISGDYAVVGAPDTGDTTSTHGRSGGLLVFERDGNFWIKRASLLSSNASWTDQIGYSVDIDGITIVAGAYDDDQAAQNSGAVFVFERSETGWKETAKLVPDDGFFSQEFGRAVAIDGDTIVVGAPAVYVRDEEPGAAYVFHRAEGIWKQQAKLTGSDSADGDRFGLAVDIQGESVIVGAPYHNKPESDGGAAYVFTRSGTTWKQQAKLTPQDVAAGDQFGVSVSIDGDRAVAGSPFDDDGAIDAGAATVFYRDGGAWKALRKLTAKDGAQGDRFGNSVALSNPWILVGAFRDDDKWTDEGSA